MRKNKLTSILLSSLIIGFGNINSRSENEGSFLNDTNITKSNYPMELSLGGSGVTNPNDGSTEFGLNFCYSIQPLSKPIWFNWSQEVGWEPSLLGATDLSSDWSWKIIKDKLYLNTGWSAGAIYSNSSLGWRSGPEISLEYYTSGNAFIFVGANYDVINKDNEGWHCIKDNSLRYSFGVGFTF